MTRKQKTVKTVIVVTRLAVDRVVATYVNLERPFTDAYVMSVESDCPIGVDASHLPAAIGQTRSIVIHEE